LTSPRPARRRGPAPERDQRESAFTEILADLVRRVPGARAAALVDRDGETVDYAGADAPYETRVAAAHWRLALESVRGQPSFSEVQSLVVRAHRASFLVHALPSGYALVVRLGRGAGFQGWQRALPACARRIGREAGWPDASGGPWFDVEVPCDATGRPRAVLCDGAEERVEVIGKHRSERRSPEQAWRVRLPSGAEVTLVCEFRRFWYADEPPRVLGRPDRPKNI
jgi:predicted regulator of Ras-like GTPase activity (Roadblock/LC7/MglB family)